MYPRPWQSGRCRWGRLGGDRGASKLWDGELLGGMLGDGNEG
jgi:hypothetical protein